MSSGFREAHSAPTNTTTTTTAAAPSPALPQQPAESSQYHHGVPHAGHNGHHHHHTGHYATTSSNANNSNNSPAAHPAHLPHPTTYGHHALDARTPRAQNANDAAAVQGAAAAAAAYGSPATDNNGLTTTAAGHGQQHQHHIQPHAAHGHDAAASPSTMHYASGAHHGLPASPADHHGSSAHAGSASPSSSHNKKNTRIPRACDLCSQRKVKCEGGQPPCRPCRELNVPCTYDRVKKRRGPPNRAAEAAREAEKRRRVGTAEAPPVVENANARTPPLQNAAEALVSLGGAPGSCGGVVMDAEQCIAPLGVLQLLVDDFFTYIHPLTPFPHEPTFREAFRAREDRTNPEFLSLLASMIATLVASFPRSARLHLKLSHNYNEFPRSIMLVDRCLKVALAMRPADAMLKDVLTVNDAAVSYFLCIAAGYTMRWSQCRRFLSEALQFLREMGFHKRRPPPTSISLGPDRPDDQSTDFISDEIGKRIYWCIFLGVRSMTQMGASSRDLIIPPATPSHPYPDYPREVDDACILADRILPQPEGVVSCLTGFVSCIRVYQTMEELVRIELAHGISAYAWDQQKQHLHSALLKVKEVAATLPPELRVDMDMTKALSPVRFPYHPQTTDADTDQDGSTTRAYQYVPPAYPNNQPNHDVRLLFAADESKKRSMQYEIQKANIYASLLATRSHYVERYLSLRDAHLHHQRAKAQAEGADSIVYRTAAAASSSSSSSSSSLAAAAVRAAAEQTQAQQDETDLLFVAERESIVQNFFSVLLSIDQCNMEPNGGSLISKIRQVACTLLSDRADRKGAQELRNEEYLRGFLEILTRLEKTGTGTAPVPSAPVGGMGMGAMGMGMGVGAGVAGGPAGGGIGGGRMMSNATGTTSATNMANNVATTTMTADDEEQELRNWVDLREQQQMMARTGFYGIIT